MESLTKPEKLEILHMKDQNGKTPVLTLAEGLSMAALARVLQQLSDEHKLSTLHSDSKIPPKVTHLKDWLKQQVEEEYYVLLTPPQAVIFYNFKGREEKSEEECQSLQKMCTEVGFPAQVVKDFTETDIEQKIRQVQSGTPSCLFVAIMAHGVRGLILDMNLRPIEINDVVTQMCCNNDMPSGIPKVLLLQVCRADPKRTSFVKTDTNALTDAALAGRSNQASSSTSGAATTVQSEEEALIAEWKRKCQAIEPHHEDLSIIVSTVSGEVSDRNVFIPLLSEQLRQAMSHDDIHKSFTKANKRLKEQTGAKAIHYNTMTKTLNFKRLHPQVNNSEL